MDKQFCPYCMAPVKPGESCPSCGLTAGSYIPSPHHLPPGTVLLGRYLVGRVLGEGGFGITYIGCDLRLELKIAIKEYYPVDRATRNASTSLSVTSFMGPSAQSFQRGKEKFLGEARAMAKLDKQQAIVSVRDYFEANNTAYIVMEYIEGTTFSQLAKQRGGRIPPEELFSMLEPLFGALAIMHSNGLIHRDISPDNLMLEHGKVRLLDFGCARETTRGTETLTIALKQGYAPVEQYQTKGQGPWTDIYALCATIYFCLTGQAPPQALDRIAGDGLLRPSKLGVPILSYQEEALLKGLAIQPRRRYQTMEELHGALYPAVEPPEPGPGPTPIPGPEPEPGPDPIPGPDPVPVTDPVPGPEPEPEPVPEPQLGPVPVWKKWQLWAGTGAAVLLVVLLAVFLPRGQADPIASIDPTPGTSIGTSTEPSDLFADAVPLPQTADELTFRALMDSGDVPAVILPAGCYIRVESEALEIDKPLLIEEGAILDPIWPVTVSQTGYVQVDGELSLDYGMLRVSGTVAVGSTGELTGSGLMWMDREDCLTVAPGGSAVLSGVSYDDEDNGGQFLALDEEKLFADAWEVTTFEALSEASQRSDIRTVVITADIELTQGLTFDKPVLIEEGVTVSGGPLFSVDEGGRDNLLLDAAVLVNRGTLACSVNAGDWDGRIGDEYCTILNYGTIQGDLFLDCPGSLLNFDRLEIFGSQILSTSLYNLGEVVYAQSSDYPDENWINFYCPVFNFGSITVAGDNAPHMHINSGVTFANAGTLEVGANGELVNYGHLRNAGRVTVTDPTGAFDNAGLYETASANSVLEMHTESDLNYGGLFQVGADTVLILPDEAHIRFSGGHIVTFRWGDTAVDESTYRSVTTEEELRQALADDGCQLVFLDDGELTVNGDLTINKRVAIGGGVLRIEGGDLTVSGVDAFLLGSVELGGGQLTVTDGAAACPDLTGCGGLTVSGGGLVVLANAAEIADGQVTLDDGQLIDLGGLSLVRTALQVESGVFRACGWLDLTGCDVEVGETGELLTNSSQVRMDGATTIVNRGIFELLNDRSFPFELSGSLTNYGWVCIDTEVELSGSLTNYGTVQFAWNGCTITGTLDNQGTVLAANCDVQTQGGGSYTGTPVEHRGEWTDRIL